MAVSMYPGLSQTTGAPDAAVVKFHLEELARAAGELVQRIDRFYTRFNIRPLPNTNIDVWKKYSREPSASMCASAR